MFANISCKQNSLQKAVMIKQNKPVDYAKKALFRPANDDPGCILFPKSPEFLKILKKAACITLPVEITYNNGTKEGVKFDAVDSSFFGNALKRVDMELINRVAVLDGGSPDDYSGIENRKNKYLPLAIICDTKQFIVVSIRKIEPYNPSTLICSFTSTGKFIDGFVANYGNGNEHWNVGRECLINKKYLIMITEAGQGNQSDGDNYTFFAIWKILNDGHFKGIRQNVKYGRDYQSDDGRFTKIQ